MPVGKLRTAVGCPRVVVGEAAVARQDGGRAVGVRQGEHHRVGVRV